jgi:hypothetical protein
MSRSSLHQHLYLLTAALLVTHEIDSAYWKEWNLFGLPGGIDLFLLLNFALVVVALLGFRWLLEGRAIGRILSIVVALAGIFAFGIYGFFLVTGHPEFREPTSIALLVLILIASIIQLRVAYRDFRGPRPRGPLDRLPQATLHDSAVVSR